jgi:propionyl-CoA synthetase
MGSIAVKLPLPPSCLPTLWNADQRFRESYLAAFPGYCNTSDAGYLDEDGYVWVMGRTDDIINVAGHRLSTGGMEEVLSSHPAVAECAVIGVRDQLKGEVPCGFVVLKSGIELPPSEVETELVRLVREKIGPVAAFRVAITVGRLPKTRSGKIMRRLLRDIAEGRALGDVTTLRDPDVMSQLAGKILRGTMKKIADGEPWSMPATIDDPAVLDEIGEALKGRDLPA